MATNRSKSKTSKRSRKTATRRAGAKAAPDAVALLKADHRQVEGWFKEFESSRLSRLVLSSYQQVR